MNPLEPCSVLLIDDDDQHTKLILLILSRRYGDRITVASSGLQGLEFAQQSAPDIVMIRLMLMESDGYDVCCRFKAIPGLSQIPVLLFAAKRPQDVYPEAQQCGAAGYLYQPYSPDALCTARCALLRGEQYYP